MTSVDVSDIPIDCDTARLREHFEEETGCVDAISYLIHPLDGDPRRAIVAFRDSNAATYVANCCHQIGNATVQMTLRPRDMFTQCTVQVDSLVLVTCTPHIEQCLRAIETELGVRVERSAGFVTLIGTLPQINSANSHLRKLWQHQVAHQERELQMIRHQSHHPDMWNDANMRQQLGEMPLTGLSGEIISSDSDTGRDRLRHRHGTEILEHGNLHDQSGSSSGRISHHDVDRGLHDISSGSLQPEPPFVASMNACRGMEEVLRRARSTPRFGSSDNFMGPNHQRNTESSIDQSTTGAISRAPDVAWVTSGSQSYQEDRCNGRVGRTSDPGTSSMEPSARTKEHDTGSRRRFSGDDCHSSGDVAYLSQWRDYRPPPAGHVAVPTTDILLERDIAGYMRQVHALDLAAIENSLHVELKFEDIGDRIRVVISLPRPYDMLIENRGMAKTHLLDLCDRISTSVEKNRVYYRVDDITLPEMEELMSSVVHKFDRLSLQLICPGDLLVIGNHSQVRQASGMIKAHIEDQWRYPAEGANQYGNEEELFRTKSHANSDKTTASISKRASKCRTNGNGYSQSKHTDHLENGRDEHLTRKTDPSGSKALKSSKSTKKTAIPKPHSYQAMEGSYSRVSSRQSNSYSVDTKWQSDVPTEIPQKSSNGTTRRGKFQFSMGGNLNVVICDGDITVETVDVIVSAANVHLANYSGVAGAISRAAGRQYEQDYIDYISKHGPLTVTGVVPMEISGPLPCRYVLHAVGPMWNLYEDKDRCSFDLRRTFYNCLCSADDLGAVSIALPAISTGIFMVPTDVCAESLLAALQQFTSERPHDRSLDVVRIVNIDSEVTEIFAIILGQLLSADVDTTDHSSAVGRVGSSSRDNQHRKNNLGRGDRAIGDAYVSSSSESSPGGTACKFVSRRSLDSRVTAVKSCSRKSRSSLVDDDIPTGEVSQYRAPRSRPSSADRLRDRESNRRRSASLDRHRSSEVLPGEQNRRPGDGSKSHSIQPHGNKQISKTLRQTLSRNRVASSSSSMPLRPSKATSRKTVASSIDSSESEVEKTDLEKCPICMDVIVLPKTLQKCGHRYCSHCIDAYFCHGKPICPVCGMVYGVLKGDQPEGGVMSWRIDHSIRLAGYVDSVGAIVIKYSFPDGVQQDHHPSPGQPYVGIKREAFLPNNVGGREVVALLKKAFDAGLVFTISDSRTTGRKDVITWNDIHHKTSANGGAIGFGYPDPTYLDRVKDELAAKGITSLEGVKKPRSTSRLQ